MQRKKDNTVLETPPGKTREVYEAQLTGFKMSSYINI